MGFSAAALLSALLSGVVIAVALRRVAAVVGVLGLHAAVMRGFDLGFFAQAHVFYLLATVTPVVVSGVILARGERSAWLVVLLVPGVLGIYATHVEPDRLGTEHVTLDADVGGLRIGVLADLQTPNIGDHERAAVQRLVDADPDLVLIAGDLWQMSDEQIVGAWPEFAALVAELVAAVDHVVIVEGDTDHIGWLDRIGASTGAHIAHDRVITLEIDGRVVVIGGTQLVVDAPTAPSAAAMSDLVALESPDVLTIALSHRPDIVHWLPGRVDLVVAGHTHGGQFQLPFIGPLVTFSDVPRSVAAGGLHEIDGQAIYVSTGVGVERKRAPQVRFGVPPTVGVIEVRGTS